MNKLIVLIFLAISLVQYDLAHIPLIVLSFLLYLCVNLIMYIVKKEIVKKTIMIITVVLVVILSMSVHPWFIFLLPINLYETSTSYISNNWIIFILSILPLFLIDLNIKSVYFLVCTLSFLLFRLAYSASRRFTLLDNQFDDMRKDIEKLTKNLNDSNEYARQTEYTIKLEERNRLSQEIHDQIGHSMTGALIQMEAAKRLITVDHEKAQQLLDNAIHISKDGIENIRLTLKNMKPPSEQIGIHRLRRLIDEFSAKHQIKVLFVHKGNLDLVTHIQWKIIIENVTEALTNTLKYSEATVVSIEIHVLNKLVKAEVKDNGKGAEQIKKGLGIRGMEERTATLNGTIITDGKNGFSVTTLLPI